MKVEEIQKGESSHNNYVGILQEQNYLKEKIRRWLGLGIARSLILTVVAVVGC